MAIVKARGIDGLAMECPELLIKYPRGFMVLDERLRKPSKEYRKKEVYVLYGPPGSCKTQFAHDYFPGHYRVPAPQGTNWWFDKYEGEEEVLFDDYAADPARKLTFGFLLELLDGYLCQVPYKGSHYWFKPKVVIITSNYHPTEWHPGALYEALDRRITHLIEYTGYRQKRIHKCPSGWSFQQFRAATESIRASTGGTDRGQEEGEEGQEEEDGSAGGGISSPTRGVSSSPLPFLTLPQVEQMLMSDETLP